MLVNIAKGFSGLNFVYFAVFWRCIRKLTFYAVRQDEHSVLTRGAMERMEDADIGKEFSIQRKPPHMLFCLHLRQSFLCYKKFRKSDPPSSYARLRNKLQYGGNHQRRFAAFLFIRLSCVWQGGLRIEDRSVVFLEIDIM